MRITGTLAAVMIAAALATAPTGAAGSTGGLDKTAAGKFTAGQGTTLPPVGFVKFCARNPAECRDTETGMRKAPMSGDRWRVVSQLNSYVNSKVSPVSDAELYGQDEYWTFPGEAGDCEDYVLMKKRYLEELGFARSALLITVVLDEMHEGHAVLTLRTDEGDFILDNRRNEIRRWSDLDYVFLKRQSEFHPHEWVSLSGKGLNASAMLPADQAAR